MENDNVITLDYLLKVKAEKKKKAKRKGRNRKRDFSR